MKTKNRIKEPNNLEKLNSYSQYLWGHPVKCSIFFKEEEKKEEYVVEIKITTPLEELAFKGEGKNYYQVQEKIAEKILEDVLRSYNFNFDRIISRKIKMKKGYYLAGKIQDLKQ